MGPLPWFWLITPYNNGCTRIWKAATDMVLAGE
jgi:hypothetical protein